MIKLRFFARGEASVCDIDALEAGTRRFLGRKFQETPEGWAFVPTKEPSEVSWHAEYVRDCREGLLWPADEATALACGVKFDPKFGGEDEAPKAPAAKSKE